MINDNEIKLPVKIKLLREGVKIPEYSTPGSSGFDIVPDIKTPIYLGPGETFLFPTGWTLEMPGPPEDPLWALFIFPRSGLGSKKRLIITQSVGLIDNDYRDEVFVPVLNESDMPIIVSPKMAIAQGVILPTLQASFEIVSDVSETSRKGGFGHTGNNGE